MNYGKGITIARTKAGMSKRRLALRVGVCASFITHIEAGRKTPSLETMEKVAGVLGVSMPLLMFLSSDSSERAGISQEQATILGLAES